MDAFPNARYLWIDSGHPGFITARLRRRAPFPFGAVPIQAPRRKISARDRRASPCSIDLHIERTGGRIMRNCFQKSAPVYLGTLLIVCLTVAAAPAQRIRAKPTNDAVRHSAAASKVVNDPRGDKGAATKPNARAIVKVSMRNMQFYPRALKIKKGDVVQWKNDDLVAHTATSVSFDSGLMNPGTSWRHTFTKAGQFEYVCTFHPMMTGVIVVK